MTEAVAALGYREAWPLEPASEPGAPDVPPAGTEPGPSAFSHALAALGTRIDGGEALITSALHNRLGALDAGTLIAVQAGIYRYAEAVDLAAKLVDRAGNSVRTVLSGSGP